jgi:hypothetical protein
MPHRAPRELYPVPKSSNHFKVQIADHFEPTATRTRRDIGQKVVEAVIAQGLTVQHLYHLLNPRFVEETRRLLRSLPINNKP